jgi:hypothetical protein
MTFPRISIYIPDSTGDNSSSSSAVENAVLSGSLNPAVISKPLPFFQSTRVPKMRDSKKCLALSSGQKFTSGIHDVVDALLEARASLGALNYYLIAVARRDNFKRVLRALDEASEALEVVYDECEPLPSFDDDDGRLIGSD